MLPSSHRGHAARPRASVPLPPPAAGAWADRAPWPVAAPSPPAAGLLRCCAACGRLRRRCRSLVCIQSDSCRPHPDAQQLAHAQPPACLPAKPPPHRGWAPRALLQFHRPLSAFRPIATGSLVHAPPDAPDPPALVYIPSSLSSLPPSVFCIPCHRVSQLHASSVLLAPYTAAPPLPLGVAARPFRWHSIPAIHERKSEGPPPIEQKCCFYLPASSPEGAAQNTPRVAPSLVSTAHAVAHFVCPMTDHLHVYQPVFVPLLCLSLAALLSSSSATSPLLHTRYHANIGHSEWTRITSPEGPSLVNGSGMPTTGDVTPPEGSTGNTEC